MEIPDLSEARVLTVRQPWASWLIWGEKNVENRSWRTSYRGWLIINAGRRWDDDLLPPPTYLDRAAYPVGALLGMIVLVDVVTGHPSSWAMTGHWHWIRGDRLAFPRPIPCRGGLGLTRPTTTMLREIYDGGVVAATRG